MPWQAVQLQLLLIKAVKNTQWVRNVTTASLATSEPKIHQPPTAAQLS